MGNCTINSVTMITALVCGLGPSVQLATPELRARCLVVGVNDIQRHFAPDHLYVQDQLSRFTEERRSFIEKSNAKIVWVPERWKGEHPRVRRIPTRSLRRRGPLPLGGEFLLVLQTSPFAAVHLAFKLGAGAVGLLGVDLAPPHPLAARLREIDAAFGRLRDGLGDRGVELVNLSPLSRLRSLPVVHPGSFLDRRPAWRSSRP